MSNDYKDNLTNRILISMVLGLVIGLLLNFFVSDSLINTILIDNLFYLGGTGFINFMKMLIVPLVFTSIVVATASLADSKKIGSLSVQIIVSYLFTVFLAIILAITLTSIINPGTGLAMVGTEYTTNLTSNVTLTDNLLNMIPSNPIGSLANGDIIPIIIFSLIIGIIISKLKDEVKIVHDFFNQSNKIMISMTNWVMQLAPIGVFCLMATTFANLGIDALIPLFKFIICVILAILIQTFIVYPILLFVFTRLNPIKFYKKFAPAMLFAFSSTSSNATLPLTLEKLDQLGVSQELSAFSIPLGATIHMDGNAIMQGCAVMFATQAYGVDLGTSALLTIIFTAVIASISAAGIPSAAIISLNMLFMSVGLPLDLISIILGIDHFLDMFRTTINVMGDAVCTIIIAFKNKCFDKQIYESDIIQT